MFICFKEESCSGYITVEASIVIPICLFMLTSVLVFSILYHDVIVARADMEDQILCEYFDSDISTSSQHILFKPDIELNASDGFMKKAIYARTFGKKGVLFHKFEVDASFSQGISVYKKKALLRTLDSVDNIYGIFSNQDVRDKVAELKSKIR